MLYRVGRIRGVNSTQCSTQSIQSVLNKMVETLTIYNHNFCGSFCHPLVIYKLIYSCHNIYGASTVLGWVLVLGTQQCSSGNQQKLPTF